jgi:hypothetical protein
VSVRISDALPKREEQVRLEHLLSARTENTNAVPAGVRSITQRSQVIDRTMPLIRMGVCVAVALILLSRPRAYGSSPSRISRRAAHSRYRRTNPRCLSTHPHAGQERDQRTVGRESGGDGETGRMTVSG